VLFARAVLDGGCVDFGGNGGHFFFIGAALVCLGLSQHFTAFGWRIGAKLPARRQNLSRWAGLEAIWQIHRHIKKSSPIIGETA
jgi:sulfite exporter TauE/SafE